MTGSTNIKYTFIADVENALKGFSKLTDQFKNLSKTSAKTSKDFSSGMNKIASSLSSASKQFKDISTQLSQFKTNMAGATKSTNALTTAFKTLSGVALGKALAESAKESIDFVENLNLFKVAMKDSIEEGQQFIATLQEMYGLDPSYLARTTGLFYEMAYAVDMPSDAARRLSLNMTALATDLGSLFNVDFEQVADNLTSGLRGMSRAVVKYGMDLRASTVEAYANAHGITAQFETMSEANREILRYLVMMEQATDASGDFARTIESPANQLRIFKEQIVQFGRAIGNFIVQPIAAALPYITGFVMAIRMVLNAIAELLGFMTWTSSSTGDFSDSVKDATSGATSGLGSIGSAASDAKKEVEDLLAPFDELNILSKDTGADAGGISAGAGGMGTGVDPQLLKLLEESQYKLEEVKLKANEVRDAILDFMGIRVWQEFDEETGRMITKLEYMPEVFEKNLIDKFPQWKKSIHALFDVDWSDAWKQLKNISKTLTEIAGLTFKNVATDLMALFNINDDTVSEAIGNLNQNLRDFSAWLSENKETIAEVAAKLIEFWLTFSVMQGIVGIAGGITSAIGSMLGVFSTFFSIMSPIGSVVGVTSTAFGALFSALGSGLKLVLTPLGTMIAKVPILSNLVLALTNTLGALGTTFAGPLAAAISGATTVFAALFVAGFAVWAANSERFGELVGDIITRLGDIFIHFGELFTAVKDLFVAGATFMADHFGSVYEAIVAIIDWILIAFDGLIEFLTGVFTGDVDKAFTGIAKIIGGIVNAIASAISGVLNAVITVVEMGLSFVVNALYDFIKGALDMVAWAADIVGIKLEFPEHIDIKLPRIPVPDPVPFANGGVVTGPTRALIGEGMYDEAVIPLGDSPQLEELVDKISQKSGNVEVRVFIGGKEWDAFTYESSKRGEKIVGDEPVKKGV